MKDLWYFLKRLPEGIIISFCSISLLIYEFIKNKINHLRHMPVVRPVGREDSNLYPESLNNNNYSALSSGLICNDSFTTDHFYNLGVKNKILVNRYSTVLLDMVMDDPCSVCGEFNCAHLNPEPKFNPNTSSMLKAIELERQRTELERLRNRMQQSAVGPSLYSNNSGYYGNNTNTDNNLNNTYNNLNNTYNNLNNTYNNLNNILFRNDNNQ